MMIEEEKRLFRKSALKRRAKITNRQDVYKRQGHSARDTFAMLGKHIHMEPKSFAVGVRIEHPQEMINFSQYGAAHVSSLGAASYKLTHQAENCRGVYSFCMCPGGFVVNASSEKGGLAVNGMSYHARDSKNANSADVYKRQICN